jgi:transposase
VNQHRPVVGRVKTLQLKREGRRWYVIVVIESEPVPLPSTGRSVGIDLVAARFLATSVGDVVANPRFLEVAQERIADLQRRKARSRPGSGNRRRLRQALAKEWRRVRNRRRDFHHKTARALVDTYDTIALEQLRVAAMTASAAGTAEHRERHPFKADVRKLKELGLTESLEVGYRLSPRGRALLAPPRGRALLARLGAAAPTPGAGGSVPGS